MRKKVTLSSLVFSFNYLHECRLLMANISEVISVVDLLNNVALYKLISPSAGLKMTFLGDSPDDWHVRGCQ